MAQSSKRMTSGSGFGAPPQAKVARMNDGVKESNISALEDSEKEDLATSGTTGDWADSGMTRHSASSVTKADSADSGRRIWRIRQSWGMREVQ
jgi:hypothetical protein